jgi:hypothetical protein
VAIGCPALARGWWRWRAPLRAALRGALSLAQARALAAGVAVGASPPALAAFVLAGLMGSRFSCRPDWVAAGPTMAYLGLGPMLVCAAALMWRRAGGR